MSAATGSIGFEPTAVAGAWLLRPLWREDERGSFARTFSDEEFAEHGLDSRVLQCSVSRTRQRGTLRGLHFQAAPHEEAKLVRCTRGAVHDVIVDLRPGSATYRTHLALRLDAAEGVQLFVPAGCAHGFLTLVDDCEVAYQMSARYDAPSARGVRWNDPSFGIAWPFGPERMSERDRSWPDFTG